MSKACAKPNTDLQKACTRLSTRWSVTGAEELVEEMEVLARNKAHGKELKWKGKLSVTEEDEVCYFL